MSTPAPFVGIDVGKSRLAVTVRPAGAAFRLDNSPAGIAELVARLAPLAGLAPYADDSGPHTGPRRICRGRLELRRIVYLAAPSASRRMGAP